MATIEQINKELINIRRDINGIKTSINRLNSDIDSRASSSNLSRDSKELRDLIKSNSTLINFLERKLAKVSLPDETRYYLSGSEVEEFKSNYNKLRAMMVTFDRLYKNLVAYSSNQS